MNIKLNEEARKAMTSAHSRAFKMQAEELGAEHILLGVLAHPSAPLVDVFDNMGVKPATLCQEIMSNLPSGSAEGVKKDLPYAKNAKEVFQAAAKVSESAGVAEIGPEHLMLGILNVEKNLAYRILKTVSGDRNGEMKTQLDSYIGKIQKRRAMMRLFNDLASTVIINAREEAEKNNSEHIEPMHILMAIINHPGSVPMAALLRLKVDLKTLKAQVTRAVKEFSGKKEKSEGLSFSDETKKVMDGAVEASESMKHKYIGPEHFLLGIMGVEGSKAAMTLKETGLRDVGDLKEEILMVLAAQR